MPSVTPHAPSVTDRLNFTRPAPTDASKRTASTPYCFSVRSIRGATLPKALTRVIEDAGVDAPHSDSGSAPLVLLKLTASFFDTDQKKFYSRTFESHEQVLRAVQPHLI